MYDRNVNNKKVTYYLLEYFDNHMITNFFPKHNIIKLFRINKYGDNSLRSYKQQTCSRMYVEK